MALGPCGADMLGTNSLRVQFAESEAPISVAKAYETLAPFGEVARLEMPPGTDSTAVVSFYDLRSAASAAAVLGDMCSQEPQYGDRTLRLDGDMQLQNWMLTEISAVRQEGDDGTYTLDFFDTRCRERAASQLAASQLAKQAAPDLCLPPGLPAAMVRSAADCPQFLPVPPDMSESGEDSHSNGSANGPRYRTDLLLSKVNWDELASGVEKRTTLRLKCLPRPLCDEQALGSLLARVGLAGMVDCVRVLPGEGKRHGSALINAVSTEAVAAVARLFHGRQFGTGTPVAVSFAAVQGSSDINRVHPDRQPLRVEAMGDRKVEEQPPRRIEGHELQSSGDEVSTEAGDDINSPRIARRGRSLSSSALRVR